MTYTFIIHSRTFNLSTFFSALSAIVRGSAIVTDSAKATYVLLIYRNKREFFLHWWSLQATQKAAWPKNVINHKGYLISLSIIDYLAFTKKRKTLKMPLKERKSVHFHVKISKHF